MTRATVTDCPHTPNHNYDDRAICRAQRYAHRKGGRVRHVVSSDEVAHLWAHRAQDDARNAKGSVYFRDDTIYSYGSHFPIARHVANKAGESAVLFTTARHSVTTSGHCSMVRGAVSHLTVFDVPNVESPQHTENLADYAQRITAHLLKAARARVNKEWDHKQALDLRAQAIAYAKFFKLKYARVIPARPSAWLTSPRGH